MNKNQKQKKDDVVIGPSKGLMGLMHKVVLFILYPLRKPKRFIVGLLLVGLICGGLFYLPIYFGAKPSEVRGWYVEKYHNFDINNLANIAQPKAETKGVDMLVEIDEPEVQPSLRKGFGRAGNGAPQTVDVLAVESDDVVRIENVERPVAEYAPVVLATQPVFAGEKVMNVTDEAGYVSVTKEVADNVLSYVSDKKEVSGEARVLGANELVLEDTYIFLHGIYSNPRTERGVRAGVFLKGLVKGEDVKCKIVALTADNAATAVCYIGDININQMMVDKGYSDKVSLQ